jgi:putative FmdB family regulatory protein
VGHQLEAVQSFADEPLTECPACEGRLRKLFSSVGVVFKGSGFYRTDSRAASANEGAKDGGTKDGSTESKAPTGAKPGGDAKSGRGTGSGADSRPSAKPATTAAA